MSRVANSPITLPKGVETTIAGNSVTVKGSKGTLNLDLHDNVQISEEDGVLRVASKNASRDGTAMAGTFRALINNMVVGVSTGFERKLQKDNQKLKTPFRSGLVIYNKGKQTHPQR